MKTVPLGRFLYQEVEKMTKNRYERYKCENCGLECEIEFNSNTNIGIVCSSCGHFMERVSM